MDVKRLTFIKQRARRCGYIAKPQNGLEEFKVFYKKYNMSEINTSGHVMEIILCFILGMMQAYFQKRRIYFFVVINTYFDCKKKADIMINDVCFQIKFDWDPVKLSGTREILKEINVNLIIIPSSTNEGSDIIDQLVEILQLVGLSSEAIKDAVENDPSFDAAVEIWDWYCRGVNFSK